MKYLLLCLTLGLLVFADAGFAKKKKKKKAFTRNYGMAGCGLGSVVMGKRGGQVSAGTTNGTAYNQMFGITFGTLNCIDPKKNVATNKVDSYLKGNTGMLAIDMVRGQGEYMNGVADILGCEDKKRFRTVLKTNYDEVFPSYDQSPMEVTDSIINVIINDNYLKSNCKAISAFT